MRPIWEGSLAFGLVNLPVRMYSATAGTELDFDMLHESDLSPIRYARVCREDGKEIPYEDVVRGYEYRSGDYVVLTEDDFKKANVRKTQMIDVVSFALEKEIDQIYAEKPYYLEPEKGAEKAYVILREALKESGKVGIAKFVIRDREHLGVVKPMNNVLVLDQIRFDDEVRSAKELVIPERDVRDKELDMALQLIDQLTEHFNPKEYKDTYKEELLEMINKKAKGKKLTTKARVPEITKAHELMKKLKASLEEAKKSRPHMYES